MDSLARWSPQPGPQLHALDAPWCNELMFGGARGGGKSDYLLGDYAADVNAWGAAWRGILFRRSYPELEELISRSLVMYPAMFPGAKFVDGKKTWTFPSGATLRMRQLDALKDAMKYQGHQYPWIGWDELCQWPDDKAYRMLIGSNRSAAGAPGRIRSSANPGGPGHLWVKGRFVDIAPGGYVPFEAEVIPGVKLTRMFIPSRLEHNQLLVANDPLYEAKLHLVGSDSLVRAWLEGDWSVIEGAYFDNFETGLHVLRPFQIPDHWLKFTAMDWGSAKPFSVGWYAIVGERCRVNDMTLPAGAMVRYREWYGCKDGQADTGIKLDVEDVGEGILSREPRSEHINYRVADRAMFATDGGPSMAERMLKIGVAMRPSDSKRLPGWSQVRQRLTGAEDGPMLYFLSTCAHLIRTLPALQHDEVRPEDVDTDSEDHVADELRYACMSRPYTIPMTPAPKDGGRRTFQDYMPAKAAGDRR